MTELHKAENAEKKRLSGKKRLIFNLILFAIPVLLLVILELGLRSAKYGNDLSLFVESENYPGHQVINKNINLRYFSKVGKTSPTSDIFLTEKPDTCFRIFVFGESTTRGFPYQAGTSFPRILYYRLQDAFPNKRIEVINLSASALTSYSAIDMLDEVLEQKPDALLYYGGHNEYYGALGVASVENGGNFRWLKKTRLKLNHLKTFQLTQNFLAKFSSQKTVRKPGEQATLMERIVKDKDIIYNSAKYKKGVEQFHSNIEEFVKKAKAKNVPVILSELVNNVKDQQPLKSVDAKGIQSANSVFNEAKNKEAQGNYNEAKELYYQAKDLDAIRFRSPEAMNEVVYTIAKKFNVPVVPMKGFFEKASPNGLIGDNIMIDHLHPTLDGYFIMADAFFNTLKDNKIIADNWDESRIEPSSFYSSNWGFTELDSLIGDLNIKYLKNGWPFKPESEINQFLANYKCRDFVDSIAFSYVTSDTMRIENKHIELALHYAKLGMPEKAFQEYYSMIKLHPYIADLYYDASKYLIAQHRYAEALALIKSSPALNKDYFYHYMLGTLQLKLLDTDQGIKHLEYAYQNMTPDAKPTTILFPLYVAYHDKGDKENEARVYDLIKQLVPDFGRLPEKEETKKPVVQKITVEDALTKAEELIRNNKLKEAVDLLKTINRTKETVRANKLLAAVAMMQKDGKNAYEYSMKVYRDDPNDIDNLNNLFILSLMIDDTNTALKFLTGLRASSIDKNKLQRLEGLYNKKLEELKGK